MFWWMVSPWTSHKSNQNLRLHVVQIKTIWYNQRWLSSSRVKLQVPAVRHTWQRKWSDKPQEICRMSLQLTTLSQSRHQRIFTTSLHLPAWPRSKDNMRPIKRIARIGRSLMVSRKWACYLTILVPVAMLAPTKWASRTSQAPPTRCKAVSMGSLEQVVEVPE